MLVAQNKAFLLENALTICRSRFSGSRDVLKHTVSYKQLFSTSKYVTDKVKNVDESNNSSESRKDGQDIKDGASKAENPKKDFFLSRMKSGRKHISPTARLQSILPTKFTETLTTDSLDKTENDPGHQQSANVGDIETPACNKDISEKQLPESAKYSRDGNKMGRHSGILPSRRISKLIPKEYWDELEDSETKQIVDDLGEHKVQSESLPDVKKGK